MRIFVTGANGYIGSAVTERLIAAGHHVAGLARSEAAERAVRQLGAVPVRGSLEDENAIREGARSSDAVIHTAMARSADAARLDRVVVETAIAALAGSGTPFVYTSGVWVMGSTGGHVVDETAPVNPTALVAWRPAHERMVLNAPGVRGIVIRPGMVYGRGQGFLGEMFRPNERGVVQYVGTGENRWSFVHVEDLADLYVRALGAPAGSIYFAASGPAVAVPMVAQAAAHGAPLEAVPLLEARRTMGPLADALALDCMVTSRKAIEELGWNPSGRPVVEELAQRG